MINGSTGFCPAAVEDRSWPTRSAGMVAWRSDRLKRPFLFFGFSGKMEDLDLESSFRWGCFCVPIGGILLFCTPKDGVWVSGSALLLCEKMRKDGSLCFVEFLVYACKVFDDMSL